jgi:hypothetical protein|tara:strand:+ start:5387 stop:6136 length:750 start_codon:yes stop_codon:yes gene_type:complete
MNTVFERGFTVIEVMLFLAVTGALFAALMVGVNTNITQQQYREGVFALSTFLQNEYSEVINPRNEVRNNSNRWACENSIITPASSIDAIARGTSDCVLLGRAVEGDGTLVRSYAVIGTEQDVVGTGDIETLKKYRPQLSTSNSQYGLVEMRMDWETSLSTQEGDSFSLLILRSPASGLLRVFAQYGELPDELATMLEPTAAKQEVRVCVEGSRGALPIHSVTIDPKISSQDGVTVVEFDPNEEGERACA